MGKKHSYAIVRSVVKEDDKICFLTRGEDGKRSTDIDVDKFAYSSGSPRISRIGCLRGFAY
jgi:hypothetical protein